MVVSSYVDRFSLSENYRFFGKFRWRIPDLRRARAHMLSPNPVKPEKDDGKIIRFDDCGLEPYAGKLQSAAQILEPGSGILQAIR
jgi:hypothetical protein